MTDELSVLDLTMDPVILVSFLYNQWHLHRLQIGTNKINHHGPTWVIQGVDYYAVLVFP